MGWVQVITAWGLYLKDACPFRAKHIVLLFDQWTMHIIYMVIDTYCSLLWWCNIDITQKCWSRSRISILDDWTLFCNSYCDLMTTPPFHLTMAFSYIKGQIYYSNDVWWIPEQPDSRLKFRAIVTVWGNSIMYNLSDVSVQCEPSSALTMHCSSDNYDWHRACILQD